MSKMVKSVKMRIMNVLQYALIAVVTLGCFQTEYFPNLSQFTYRTMFISFAVCYLILSMFLYRVYNVYKVGLYQVGEVIYSQVVANLICDILCYLFVCLIYLRLVIFWPVLIAFLIQAVISIVWSNSANRLYFKLHNPQKTLLIYRTPEDLQGLSEISQYKRRFTIADMLEDPKDIFEILNVLDGYGSVFISGIEATLRNGIVKACIDKNINCYFIPHTGDVIIAGAKQVPSFSVPIVEVRRAFLKPEYAFIKRLFDIICSSIGLIISSPFMLIVAASIKICDRGPVLYKQIRLTKDGKKFTILKFRSMRVDAEKDGVARLASEHDERITPVGRIIRMIRFDELPQLINILKGDMSFVGPRPERPEIAAKYEEQMPAFSLRLQVKAGLTGTAQVYGKYNTDPKDKLKMDLMYINHMSIIEDLKLMFATVRILFMKESTHGVSEGQTTASRSDVEKSA